MHYFFLIAYIDTTLLEMIIIHQKSQKWLSPSSSRPTFQTSGEDGLHGLWGGDDGFSFASNQLSTGLQGIWRRSRLHPLCGWELSWWYDKPPLTISFFFTVLLWYGPLIDDLRWFTMVKNLLKMMFFHSYVKLPEGDVAWTRWSWQKLRDRWELM